MRYILKFLGYPLHLKILCVRVLFLAFYYKRLIADHAFRDICERLGNKGEISPEGPEAVRDAQQCLDVRRAVRIVCPRLHFKNECLVEACIAKRLLLHEKMTVYMGLARAENGRMRAHAWARCGDMIITGAEGREQFTVTATFA